MAVALWNTLFTLVFCAVVTVTVSVNSGDGYGQLRSRNKAGHPHKEHHSHKQIQVPKSGEKHDVKFLADDEVMHDHDHLEEELPSYLTKEQINEMTPAEKDYHYFKLHDYDDNRYLDGLELLSALSHVVQHDYEDEDRQREEERDALLSEEERKVIQEHRHKQREEKRTQMEDFYIELIDRELNELDANNDGVLSYIEYIIGRRRKDGQTHYRH
ncbi:unnamed protein product [Meganyctiphanes norvegica]|uniref:Uncharacterized protein n=1 Tax=Meganyctiphanes norvegica TaxID=48144 RepID=A0AAV2RDM6_MEGNR